MSHSCTPNCQAVVMACNGRLTIAVYTLRYVQPGEELTFDYSSVTESEKEFRCPPLMLVPRTGALSEQCSRTSTFNLGPREWSLVVMQGSHLLVRHTQLPGVVPVLRGQQGLHASAEREPQHAASGGHPAAGRQRAHDPGRSRTP